MKAFDPGWVPHGFIKGEPLRLVRARGAGYVAAIIEQDIPDILRDACCITVPDRMMQQAAVWLAEWNKG